MSLSRSLVKLIVSHLELSEGAAVVCFALPPSHQYKIKGATAQKIANFAVRSGWLEAIQSLAENKETKGGYDPGELLYHAVEGDRKEVVETVLASGATYADALSYCVTGTCGLALGDFPSYWMESLIEKNNIPALKIAKAAAPDSIEALKRELKNANKDLVAQERFLLTPARRSLAKANDATHKLLGLWGAFFDPPYFVRLLAADGDLDLLKRGLAHVFELIDEMAYPPCGSGELLFPLFHALIRYKFRGEFPQIWLEEKLEEAKERSKKNTPPPWVKGLRETLGVICVESHAQGKINVATYLSRLVASLGMSSLLICAASRGENALAQSIFAGSEFPSARFLLSSAAKSGNTQLLAFLEGSGISDPALTFHAKLRQHIRVFSPRTLSLFEDLKLLARQIPDNRRLLLLLACATDDLTLFDELCETKFCSQHDLSAAFAVAWSSRSLTMLRAVHAAGAPADVISKCSVLEVGRAIENHHRIDDDDCSASVLLLLSEWASPIPLTGGASIPCVNNELDEVLVALGVAIKTPAAEGKSYSSFAEGEDDKGDPQFHLMKAIECLNPTQILKARMRGAVVDADSISVAQAIGRDLVYWLTRRVDVSR